MNRFKGLLLALVALALVVVSCRKNTEPREATANEPAAAVDPNTPQFDPGDRWALAGAPLKGSPNGLVTIVEFSDFECPFCGRVNPTMEQILSTPEFAGKVRIVFKQLPLSFHQNANLAAQAALAAHAQSKFWEMHDLLFQNQRALTRPDLDRYAQQLGLDMTAFAAALDGSTFAAKVTEESQLAERLGIRGTPNFMVNGRQVTGARPFDDFAAIIREEVTAMQALVDQGKSVGEAYGMRLDANAAAAPPAQAQQDRPRPAEPDPNAELYVPVGESPVMGAADALITVVVFSEFQCPFCSRVEPTLAQLRTDYGNDIRIVFKHNPLPFHDRATPAAQAAIAAQNQGKFWEMHDLMFQNQQALTDENFTAWATQLGLNLDRFRTDMASEATAARIREDQALATRLAARGTPHFFINGYRLRGAQPIDRFKQLIDQRIVDARAAVDAGTARAGVYDRLQEDAIRGEAPMLAPQAGAPAAAAAPAEPSAPVTINVGSSPTQGPADAKVTIAIWTDFQCPFCSRFENNLNTALEGVADRVRVVVKQYPLPFHQNAHLAAEAALAANAQGKYWEMHALLFQNQQALARPDLERYAEQIGLNMQQFRAALDEGTFRATVDAEMAEGTAVGVTGTPAWYVNGMKFGGARPPEAIRAEIDRALAAP